jgi:arabinofuranan 3-O-arabinosyltransferase
MTTRTGDQRAAGRAAADAGGPDATSGGRPRIRLLRWFVLVWAGVFGVLLANAPGRMVFDTKLGVDVDPAGFLAGLWHLWDPQNTLGALQDQAIGYAVPMGPFYLAGQLAHLPVWVTERAWMSLLVAAGFAGLVALAGALRIGSPRSRLLAGLAFALWPTFTIVIGSTSVSALPGLLAPWAVLPLAGAVRGRGGWRAAAVAAARSGAVVLLMGGVNAAVTIDALLLPALFILTHARGRRLARLAACWAAAVAAAAAWWALPLLLQGRYAFNFLPYVEQASTTTGTASAAAVLRGAGNWTAYFNLGTPWLPAGWALVTTPFAIAAAAAAAACGLYGLAARDLPHAGWLRLSAGVAAAGALAGYGGPLGGPFHRQVQQLLDGPLAPFRNVYKLEPVIAAALALGLAHAAARWLAPAGAWRSRPGPRAVTVGARVVVGVALVGLALPYLSGRVLNPGSFAAVPRYWYRVAAWLAANSPRNPALVVPADAHGEYLWGDPIDDPLEALASSPWAQRGLVPYGGPGSQVLLATAEDAVESGEQVPGLAGYLGRAGIRYVVVRNDLDPGQPGYTPAAIVHQTLALSGYTRVAAFGPPVADSQAGPQPAPRQQAPPPSYPAVEVYAPAGAGPGPPSPVATLPVSRTVLVDGGPGSLLQLAGQGLLGPGQPAVIAGDRLPTGRPALWAVTDGQRRADTLFGLTSSNVSFTYTAAEVNPPDDQFGDQGGPPRQLLPVPAAGHQTVAVLSGAASVTASSYGARLADTQQDDPAAAFDGDPATAWAEGSPVTPVGQWIQISFTRPVAMPAGIGVRLLDDSAHREIAAALRVSTAAGSVTTRLAATGAVQRLRVVPGRTGWLRVTIAAARRVSPGAPGAGISDVLIPGVKVTRLLQPAEDPAGTRAAAVAFSFRQQVPSPFAVTDPFAPSDPAAVPPMARTFTVPRPVTLRLAATALALPGPGLDALLDRLAPPGPGQLQVSVASAPGALPPGFPASLVTGSGGRPWLADTASPVIHLSWRGQRRISWLVVRPATSGASVPRTVRIASPDGTRQAGIGPGGLVAVSPPLVTDRIDISFPRVQQAGLVAVTGQLTTLPVALWQLSVPALAGLRPVAPAAAAGFSLPCGRGPALAVDGRAYQTQVSGTVGELAGFLPLRVRLCAPGGRLALGAGRHVLAAAPGTFAVTGLSLAGAGPAPAAAAAAGGGARAVRVVSWRPDQRRVQVGPGGAAYLEVHQNDNPGWAATLDGRPLTPVRLDGWQQGFVVPAGPGGAVTLTFRPAAAYHLALIAAAAAAAVLLAAAAWPLARRRARAGPARPAPAPAPGAAPEGPPAPAMPAMPAPGAAPAVPAAGAAPAVPAPAAGPAPGAAAAGRRAWAGWLAVTALLAVAGGPAALAVVPLACLACLARLRPRALPALAFAAMAAAGLLSAARPLGAGPLGPFGAPAQACALAALAAALMPALTAPAAARRRPGPARTAEPATTAAEAGR